ncbi:NAD-dependent epimerase/dehydratase [Streptomyces davaonensis JCM 4913]|uniref:NAD-dependent epimerase/dehydratase n=1 Tax=Streptomyces davaonensis (strain DSM 101723 / JCM 4913 / KCC S-0913 / 768) TaxID=1214101 RepID=K4R3I2_STRDJ|nr:NAD(P)-dependent oxidoreductase [Streptomyces davaonensis]CCK27702.1 NAD-dependent epimerase/dehydratase [Streptomyces davaonensis JCM 4913]
MKVLVTGATGAVGSRLVPQLVEAGHTVVAATTSEAKTARLCEAGAEPIVLDVLDTAAVRDAVRRARPDVIIHQATALAGNLKLRKVDRDFAVTNQLRTKGTQNLLTAAAEFGVRRFVAQSAMQVLYARTGGPVKTEEDPLDTDPAPGSEQTLAAIRFLERAVTSTPGIDGIVLRYGGFYGPGTSIAPGGEQLELLHKRRFPVVGGGGGVWSFTHIEDAAGAAVAAVEGGAPGIYNIVDDEPAPLAEWLPALAAAVGANKPMSVPRWLGRLLAGEFIARASTEIRGASNAKAKKELGWTPRYASWRRGFAELGRS